MITFFVLAGTMLVVALFFVLPPLIGKKVRIGAVSHGDTNLSIYRDQLRELEADLVNGTLDSAQYEVAKREIERRALDDVDFDSSNDRGHTEAVKYGGPKWTLASSIAVLIPLVTISTYLVLGNPVALDPSKLATESKEGPHDLSPQKLAKMIERVGERLRENPDDVEGWVMLAKTTQAVGRYEESVRAYREVLKRVPPDAQLLADFADTLAMANGRTLEGEPQELIAQALKVDPKNIKALALGGTVAYQKENFAEAVQLWQRVLALVPQEEEFARRIRDSVAEAQVKASSKSNGINRPPKLPAPKIASDKQNAPVLAKVGGKVELAPSLATAVAKEYTVYVFARAANGPRMPLAIVRLAVKDLPATFELTDAMAMAPGMSISNFPELLIGARISKSGNATPQSGDWESELVPVALGATGVSLVISRLVR